ncbi:hypothetical protein GTW46_45125 [Streptomyces sp. SID6013]|nr:hypothetical protein [Streptomyces sp. SID6013]
MFSVCLVHPQVMQDPVESGYGLGKSMLGVGLVGAIPQHVTAPAATAGADALGS